MAYQHLWQFSWQKLIYKNTRVAFYTMKIKTKQTETAIITLQDF